MCISAHISPVEKKTVNKVYSNLKRNSETPLFVVVIVSLLSVCRTGMIREHLLYSGYQDSSSPRPSLQAASRTMPGNTQSLLTCWASTSRSWTTDNTNSPQRTVGDY